jgi:hypothetical protein
MDLRSALSASARDGEEETLRAGMDYVGSVVTRFLAEDLPELLTGL